MQNIIDAVKPAPIDSYLLEEQKIRQHSTLESDIRYHAHPTVYAVTYLV